MAIKTYRPTTAARRGMTVLDYSELTKTKPKKSLLKKINKKSGRNNTGKITVRHHGGGNKRKYRVIDFKRDKQGMNATIKSIEYDPNRSCNIALVKYEDGEFRYITAADGFKIGDVVCSGEEVEIRLGNALPLKNIPVGTFVHNVELYPKRGAAIGRSAGNSVQLMAKENQHALIKLPSGELRKIPIECYATIGIVGNLEKSNINLGKAGRKRHLGIRPTVRGSVMNPNDHPHGGGEGKSPIGRPGPVTPWGKPTLGFKTRNKKKASNKFIVRRRKGK